jgi:excisionase family DNA binding protein
MLLYPPKPVVYVDNRIVVTIDGITDVIYISEELFNQDVHSIISFVVNEANALLSRREVFTADLVSSGEACKRLGVHAHTLRKWANDGEIDCIRTVGKHRRYKLSEIEKKLKLKENV